MRIPNPIATTTTEAYLAYKAGVLSQADMKEKLYHPYIHIDGRLAYWTGLIDTYPIDKNGNPECLTDEEAYIAYLAGVTSEYPENVKNPADPRMASYLKYIISAKFRRPNYPVTREELYLSMMKPPVVTNETPSSSIELDDTTEAPFISVEMYGDVFQKNYIGKNLCGISDATYNAYGVDITIKDGEVTINGKATSNGAVILRLINSSIFNGDYTTNLIYVSGTPGKGNFNLRYKNNNTIIQGTQTLFRPLDSTSSYTVNNKEVSYGIYIEEAGTIFYDYKFKAQIISGRDKDTDFEPYVGGIPAPSPDYPQEVKTVSGEQKIMIFDGEGNSNAYFLNFGFLELHKLSNWQDRIFYNDGWKLEKKVGKMELLTLSEYSLNASLSNETSLLFQSTPVPSALQYTSTTNDDLVCNRFSVYNCYNKSNTLDGICYYQDRVLNIRIRKSLLDTPDVAGFRAWLSRNPTFIYYRLNTPSISPVIDRNLITQLDELREAGSCEAKTRITVTATSPNLPALLKVEAGEYR